MALFKWRKDKTSATPAQGNSWEQDLNLADRMRTGIHSATPLDPAGAAKLYVSALLRHAPYYITAYDPGSARVRDTNIHVQYAKRTLAGALEVASHYEWEDLSRLYFLARNYGGRETHLAFQKVVVDMLLSGRSNLDERKKFNVLNYILDETVTPPETKERLREAMANLSEPTRRAVVDDFAIENVETAISMAQLLRLPVATR